MNGVSASSIIKATLAVVAVLVVLVVLFTGYGGLGSIMSLLGMDGAQGQGVQGPRGDILLSIVSTGTETTTIAPLVVAAETGDVFYLSFDDLDEGVATTLQYNVSSNARMATFLGAPVEENTPPAVYRAELPSVGGYPEVVAALQAGVAAARPTEDDYFRQMPVISNDGAILYASIDRETYESTDSLEVLDAEDWSIYRIDEEGTELVTEGLAPRWIDTSSFAFLKNDGIYFYDSNSKEEDKVWSLANVPDIADSLDVSDDAQIIAFADQVNGVMSIIRALDWKSKLFALADEVPVSATSLAIAPDNSYVALFGVVPSEEDQNAFEQIFGYYSIEQKNLTDGVFKFDTADINSFYLTDWR